MKKVFTGATVIMLIIFILGSMSVEAKGKRKYKVVYKTVTYEIYKKEYLGEFYITHYCPCSRCCGKWGGRITASGTVPTVGRTVGVNPKLIPYGTKLQVGVNTYVAEDTGGGIGWKHLDIFCSSHSEALSRGVGYKPVYKLTPVTKTKKVKVKIPLLKAKIKDWRVEK